MSFAARIAAQAALVYDLRVQHHGEARYFIIRVDLAKREAFLKAVSADVGFTLEDFGQVLHRGWDAPEEALKSQLSAQFGLYAGE